MYIGLYIEDRDRRGRKMEKERRGKKRGERGKRVFST